MTTEYYSDIPAYFLRDKDIFEIGAGNGTNQLFSRHADIFRYDCSYFGIDKNRNDSPLLPILKKDILDMNVEYLEDNFDTVLMMHVLEHIREDQWKTVFDKINCLLRPGGWLVIAAPYNEPEDRPRDPEHMTFKITEEKLSQYLPSMRMFRSSIKYPKKTGLKKIILWTYNWWRGKRDVPYGMTRYSFISFWRYDPQ